MSEPETPETPGPASTSQSLGLASVTPVTTHGQHQDMVESRYGSIYIDMAGHWNVGCRPSQWRDQSHHPAHYLLREPGLSVIEPTLLQMLR